MDNHILASFLMAMNTEQRARLCTLVRAGLTIEQIELMLAAVEAHEAAMTPKKRGRPRRKGNGEMRERLSSYAEVVPNA